MAVFNKDIASLVRPSTDIIFMDVNSIYAATNTSEVTSEQFTRTRPNNEEGVNLKGLELGYQTFFTDYPGLLSNTGLQVNYTFIDNSDPQVLTAASKHNYNVGVFYDSDTVGARVSYT